MIMDILSASGGHRSAQENECWPQSRAGSSRARNVRSVRARHRRVARSRASELESRYDAEERPRSESCLLIGSAPDSDRTRHDTPQRRGGRADDRPESQSRAPPIAIESEGGLPWGTASADASR